MSTTPGQSGRAKIREEPHETEHGEYQYAAEDLMDPLRPQSGTEDQPEDWGMGEVVAVT